MKLDLTKTGKSIDAVVTNSNGLEYDDVFGAPVIGANGDIVGFVKDVSKNHIYLHIFDKALLDAESYHLPESCEDC